MELTLLLSVTLSFALTALLGKILVPALRRAKAGQAIKEDGPTWHMNKQGTPTMGGLMFIVAIGAVAVLLSVIEQDFSGLSVFLFALVFGVIGFIDDFAKLKKKENTGLSAPAKFLLQLAAAIAFTVLLRCTGHLSPNLYIPFFNTSIILPFALYMVFAALVMVGTVNAVNITDGIDGLCSGVTIPVALFFTIVAAAWGYGTVACVAASLVGALLAFLFYNFHPAKVFMGDTGSLFLGGMVCGLAFVLDIPLVLLFVGIIYIVETMSDIIQVLYFKATHGKRIFKMAPLHHHFELCGWSEKKLFVVFTVISTLGCIVAWFGILGKLAL
ncbi:MAG: phospho-N-acetylmuramoyl-pentapeptide-transferase [Oscillospiraceae bacterium]